MPYMAARAEGSVPHRVSRCKSKEELHLASWTASLGLLPQGLGEAENDFIRQG
jgi:hypothetical protein